jgi:hypothetical protein
MRIENQWFQIYVTGSFTGLRKIKFRLVGLTQPDSHSSLIHGLK